MIPVFITSFILIGLTVPLARRVAEREDDPRMLKLILVALVAKLTGAMVRHYVAFQVYEGGADSVVYHQEGTRIARYYRDFHFTGVPNGPGGSSGTVFIRKVTGAVYAITGPNELAGFLVFSWMGFWGLYFFYRAFRIAVRDGDHRRYAILVFFLPSLLFWPSSIGKEAWMTLTIGATAYGTAKILARERGALLFLAFGLWGTTMVRPHVAVILFIGLAAAYLFRRSEGRTSALSPITKVFGICVMLAVGAVLIGRFNDRFDSPEKVIDKNRTQTEQGGSSFNPPDGRNPVEFPLAVVTVLFRPFPGEAHNTQGVVSAVEGVVLIGLFVRSWRRFSGLPKRLFRTPYLLFSGIYCMLFVYGFSSVGNFGILVRQRVQLFPFALVLLALPAAAATRSRFDRTAELGEAAAANGGAGEPETRDRRGHGLEPVTDRQHLPEPIAVRPAAPARRFVPTRNRPVMPERNPVMPERTRPAAPQRRRPIWPSRPEKRSR